MPDPRGQDRVEPIELFFDLVFVFILLQITRTIVSDGSLTGIVHGTLVLALVWWVWVAFTSMANMGLPDSDARDWRPLIFALAMGLLLLMALSIPEAFWANSKLFAYSYLGLAVLAAGGQFWVTRHNRLAVRALRRMWMVSAILPVLIVITSYIDDATWSVILISLGIATALIAPFVAGADDLPISTAHLAERYSLFMLITLGESIISIGEGASRATMSGLLIACVLIALALVIILWRHYVVAVLRPGERALQRLQGIHLTAFARYGYTFAHLAMVWSIVMVAVAIKSALADLTTPLEDLLEAFLPLGTLVFLVTTLVFSRLAGQRQRALALIPVILLVILVVLGPQLPTAILLVAVTLAAALGIDPRAIRLRSRSG